MLYLVGLGLNEKSISLKAKEIIEKCKKVYLESYTVNFPYKIDKLERIINKKIIKLERKEVESDMLVREAEKQDIALLVYGSPLFATTHISLILDANKEGVKTKIIYSASVFDAIAETGLQLYKFGKISSMPKQEAGFLQYVRENKIIGAHSLILVDVGLDFQDAIDRIEKETKKENLEIDKIVVCSSLGTKESKIIYGKIENLRKKQKIQAPFCFIIPAELHFMEKEAVERFEK